MSWSSIPAIDSLQRDLDEKFPNRTRPDWIVGDPDHSSRVSDHNPDSDGQVHAIDIRLGGDLDPRQVLNATIGDRRVKYVIFNHRIYSRTYGWESRQYNGSNPHTTHIHVSFRYEAKYENDTSPWFETRKTRTRPVPIDLSEVRDQFLKAMDLREGRVKDSPHIRRLQRAFNAQYRDRKIGVDGIVGREVLRAWAHHERAMGGAGRRRIPDRISLNRLLQPRWKMVP